jgi:hypothetical protein
MADGIFGESGPSDWSSDGRKVMVGICCRVDGSGYWKMVLIEVDDLDCGSSVLH